MRDEASNIEVITMKKIIFIITFFFVKLSFACTGFGIITNSGTLIGKNRDFAYNPQQFELMRPIQQFHNWYDNNYNHNNIFYALTSRNEVTMGVNEHGLTVIEEDSIRPLDFKKDRMFLQPENGTAESMVIYGILQNFNTVDELIPFIPKIFSVAGPHFYQISDAKKVITVEVAFGKTNSDPKRKFSYKIISTKNDYITHTNTYLSPEFIALNDLTTKVDSVNGANNRLQRINDLISHARNKDINTAAQWFIDTYSNVSSNTDPDYCQNTSIFRSRLGKFTSVDMNIGNDKIYGTVSTMIVSNTGNFKTSYIYLKMIESITTDKDNKQTIKYKVLYTSLAKLFKDQKPTFVEHEMVRNPPVNRVCS